MTTLVPGPLARPVGRDSFAHLTGAAVLSLTGEGVEFDADLPAEKVAEIRAFLTSRDDADQAARANLAALYATAAAETATCDDVQALTVALAAYLLGDTP